MEAGKFERGELLFLHVVGRSKPNKENNILDLAQKILGDKYVKESDVVVEINIDGTTQVTENKH
tara:strand:+ start:2598 stop:2789 length:192 start_codon:yes stop_codon:yes gene_type:complete